MVLLHLQLDETALDADGESVDCNVGGEVQRLPGMQVEPGAVPRAFHPAALLVQLTYFGRFWAALARRFWLTLRSAR